MLPAEEFALVSEELFRLVFGSARAKDLERVDFAVLVEAHGKLAAFVSCYEHQAGELYIQYGGALPDFQRSPRVLRGYRFLLRFLLAHYPALMTRIENSNSAMLRLALSCGWLIVGLRMSSNRKLLVELSNSRPQFEAAR